MRSSMTIAVIGLAAAAVAGCGLQLDKARGVTPSGSAFDVNLYAEYLTLSQSEYDEADYKDADAFASRAIAAAGGSSPVPEAVSERDLPPGTSGELMAARNRLVTALSQGAAEKAPMAAARAQAMYECWMQEQEENIQPDDIAACKAEFETAMGKVDAAMGQPMAAAAPAPAPAPAPMAATPEPKTFIVFFDFDSATLSPEAQAVIGDVVGATDGMKTVMAVGHTDRAGTTAYNQGLSERRVQAVAAALQAAGLPSSVALTSAGRGEDLPRVPTVDGEREPGNRRVEITLNP